MDAIKFVKTLQRKFKDENRDEIIIRSTDDAGLLVDLVEEWAKDHPAKTRQSMFLEQYPNARRDCQDILCVCPVEIFGDTVCLECPALCSDCLHKFWMQEVE